MSATLTLQGQLLVEQQPSSPADRVVEVAAILTKTMLNTMGWDQVSMNDRIRGPGTNTPVRK